MVVPQNDAILEGVYQVQHSEKMSHNVVDTDVSREKGRVSETGLESDEWCSQMASESREWKTALTGDIANVMRPTTDAYTDMMDHCLSTILCPTKFLRSPGRDTKSQPSIEQQRANSTVQSQSQKPNKASKHRQEGK